MNKQEVNGADQGTHDEANKPLYDQTATEFNPEPISDEEEGPDNGVQAPDGGWGWLCVLGCAITHFVTSGMERSGGVLLVELRERFGQSAGVTAWVISLNACFRLLFGPVASVLSNKYSCRKTVLGGGLMVAVGVLVSGFAPSLIFLYFSYGLVSGLGKSFAYTPGLVIVGQYFKKKRGMAVGLATAGGGVGTLVVPPVMQILLEEFRYQGALMILSGVALQICVAGCLYMPLLKYLTLRGLISPKSEPDPEVPPHDIEGIPLHPITNRKNSKKSSLIESEKPLMTEKETKEPKKVTDGGTKDSEKDKVHPEKKQKLLDCNLLRNPIFSSLCIAISFLAIAFNSVLVFIPPLAVSIGISKLEAALVLSMAGVCDTISRFVSGVLLDMKCVKPYRMIIYNGALFCLAILTFSLTFVTAFSHLLVIAALYGLFIGTYSSQKSVILADLLGADALSSSFGILICFQGVGTLIGPPITGLLQDVSETFKDGFYFASGITLIGALIMSSGNIYQIYTRRQKDKSKPQTES